MARIIGTRHWWTETKSKNKAHLIWTELKVKGKMKGLEQRKNIPMLESKEPTRKNRIIMEQIKNLGWDKISNSKKYA